MRARRYDFNTPAISAFISSTAASTHFSQSLPNRSTYFFSRWAYKILRLADTSARGHRRTRPASFPPSLPGAVAGEQKH